MTFTHGIHVGVPADVYHAAHGVSNSDLKLFGGRSPAHYAAKVEEEATEEETKSQRDGTLLHLALLESDKFGEDLSHYVRPAGMTFVTKEGKAWRDGHQDKPILTISEHRNIVGAVTAVYRNPTAKALLVGRGRNEVSVFAEHPQTGLTLRMRADRLTEDASGRPWIVDIKSCPDVRKFAYSARDFRYDVQGVYYTDVLELAGIPNAAFAFVAVEIKPTNGVHGVRVVMLDEETQAKARAIYDDDLARFAECQRLNSWPGYGEEIEYITVKRFA